MDTLISIAAKVAMAMGAVAILLEAVIAIAMIVPGQEPERTLRRVLAWVKSRSRK